VSDTSTTFLHRLRQTTGDYYKQIKPKRVFVSQDWPKGGNSLSQLCNHQTTFYPSSTLRTVRAVFPKLQLKSNLVQHSQVLHFQILIAHQAALEHSSRKLSCLSVAFLRSRQLINVGV
jgi:hypothetical protein